MSNIFINRNRSQGAYNVPIIKQKFLTSDQSWYKRAKDTVEGSGDTFYKTSLRYGANPDLSPKHVGMAWSIIDTCDVVKLNQEQMQEKWRKTETSKPLFKAYNTYENPNQSYERRLEQYPGPGSPVIHPTMQSNGFRSFQNAGGLSTKEDLKSQINSIAERIARAKEIKGVLCLNNGKSNGGSFKTPPIDLALKNLQGFKGGETAQRFYMKFPIYRPRGHGPPDVSEDIQAIWENTIDPNKSRQSFFQDGGSLNASLKRNEYFDSTKGLFQPNDGNSLFKHSKRSNSIAQDNNLKSKNEDQKTIKFSGKSGVGEFPRRQRFNEDTNEVIQEQKDKIKKLKVNSLKQMENDQRSQFTQNSKKSLTASELSRFFKKQKEKNDEEIRSKLSLFSKRSGIVNRQLNQIQSKDQLQYDESKQIKIVPEEITYDSDKSADGEKQNQSPRDPQAGDDALTVATSAYDLISVAPTEMLAKEYKTLMEQYETEIQNRKNLEHEIEKFKRETQ